MIKAKKLRLICLIVFTHSMIAVGCGEKRDTLEKIKDLEFTVITEENAPEELLAITEEKKEEGFKLTFQDNGFLYICRGYGKQPTGGFCIRVDALYETENAIYFDTTLEAGECLLLCSDGLTNMLADEEIKHILDTQTTVQAKASELVLAANRNGGRDNIAVVIVEQE